MATPAVDDLRLAALSGSYETWDAAQAVSEVGEDVERLVSSCESRRESHLQDIATYAAKRTKVARPAAMAAIALAQLVASPLVADDDEARGRAYAGMLDLALRLNATFVARYSAVEDATMRGWPRVNRAAHG